MAENPYRSPLSEQRSKTGASRRRAMRPALRGLLLGFLAGAPCGVLMMALIRAGQQIDGSDTRPAGVDLVGACFGALAFGSIGALTGSLALALLNAMGRRATKSVQLISGDDYGGSRES